MEHQLDPKLVERLTVVSVLKSAGFAPVVKAIRNKCPGLAEAIMMDLEADHVAHWHEYTPQENMTVVQACEECWKRISRLKYELMEEIA